MFKNLQKWLVISFCALLVCGVFSLYIVESISAIQLDQATRESEAMQAFPTPFALFAQNSKAKSGKAETRATARGKLISPQNGDTADTTAAPSAKERANSAQWRVIDRSDSYDGQLQYYSPSNVSLEGGRVVITTREEFMGDKRYTSGMVESNSAYLYGRFSFVIDVSEGKGLFPAIWLMPVENKALPEIDIFEMIGSVPDAFYGVVHYMDGSVQNRDFFKTKVEKEETYLIELEWTEDWLRWFIDGQCMLETSKFIPNEPMYLIVNQAVGGNWAGSPNKATVFPATFVLESWAIEPEWSQPR
ncbi:MAG: glycoside hydrolase family 16 protein [Candidatus Pelethousia sp.]|nr:glycoside hydrolase family 16 protein [Candidatus Pelethousia sp.]